MKRSRLAFLPLHLSCCIRKKTFHHAACGFRSMQPPQWCQQTTRHLSIAKHATRHADSDSFNTNDNDIIQNPKRDRDHPYLDPENKYLALLKQDKLQLATSRPGVKSRFHQPIVYHPNYSFPEWPPNQTFPMTKFYNLAKTLTSKLDHLPRPLVRSPTHFFQPLNCHQIPEAWFAQPTGPISPTFLHRFLSASLERKEELRIGFRECCKMDQVRERTVLEVAGTVLASQLAFRYGMATNAAGGTHHAHSEMGAGYTILNDLAITVNFLVNEELNGGTVTGVKKVLVVDGDVHQGDGTAKFASILGDSLVTLSLHCDSNYPTYKAESTYDVPLPDHMEDEEYMQAFEESVNRAMEETQPDFVLYDAGVDVHKDDLLGRLSLSEKGIRRRDRWIFDKCVREGVPVVGVIGGGYDKDPDTLARRHAIVHEEAAYVWRAHKLYDTSTRHRDGDD